MSLLLPSFNLVSNAFSFIACSNSYITSLSLLNLIYKGIFISILIWFLPYLVKNLNLSLSPSRYAKNTIVWPPCFSLSRSSFCITSKILNVISLPFWSFKTTTSFGFDLDSSSYSLLFMTLYPQSISLYLLLPFSCLYIAFKHIGSFVLNGYSLSEITFVIWSVISLSETLLL